uniref:Uncharacterized protein n=1 Tax=Anthurium amnicola TaxID=1678845 RepID=A0A1D1XED8_9ARAE
MYSHIFYNITEVWPRKGRSADGAALESMAHSTPTFTPPGLQSGLLLTIEEPFRRPTALISSHLLLTGQGSSLRPGERFDMADRAAGGGNGNGGWDFRWGAGNVGGAGGWDYRWGFGAAPPGGGAWGFAAGAGRQGNGAGFGFGWSSNSVNGGGGGGGGGTGNGGFGFGFGSGGSSNGGFSSGGGGVNGNNNHGRGA